MNEFETRLAQARLSEDVGEADKDNEEDSCVNLLLTRSGRAQQFADCYMDSNWRSKTPRFTSLRSYRLHRFWD